MTSLTLPSATGFRPPAVPDVDVHGFWGERIDAVADKTVMILYDRCVAAGMFDQIDPARPVPEVRDESLAPLLAWAQERLGEPLTVAELAARARVSPATLHRRFRAQLGTTPLAWLTGERVALACRLIERGEERLDVVAARSGLGTAANLRGRLRRATGLSPSAYRRRFGICGGEALVS